MAKITVDTKAPEAIAAVSEEKVDKAFRAAHRAFKLLEEVRCDKHIEIIKISWNLEGDTKFLIVINPEVHLPAHLYRTEYIGKLNVLARWERDPGWPKISETVMEVSDEDSRSTLGKIPLPDTKVAEVETLTNALLKAIQVGIAWYRTCLKDQVDQLEDRNAELTLVTEGSGLEFLKSSDYQAIAMERERRKAGSK